MLRGCRKPINEPSRHNNKKNIAMKSIIFSIAGVLSINCFNSPANAQRAIGDDIVFYFKENVAIIDAKIRTIDKENYVKELILKDFKKTEDLPAAIEFDGVAFVDNGLGFDRASGDGIYTSADKSLHSDKVPYSPDNPERSVLDRALADVKFSYKNELTDYLSSIAGKLIISFDCDIYSCHCSSCSCKTCWMPIIGPAGGTLGYVTHCVKVKDCHFTITWQ